MKSKLEIQSEIQTLIKNILGGIRKNKKLSFSTCLKKYKRLLNEVRELELEIFKN